MRAVLVLAGVALLCGSLLLAGREAREVAPPGGVPAGGLGEPEPRHDGPALRGRTRHAVAPTVERKTPASDARAVEIDERLVIVLRWRGPKGSVPPDDISVHFDYWAVPVRDEPAVRFSEFMAEAEEFHGLGTHRVVLPAGWRARVGVQSDTEIGALGPYRRYTTCKPIRVPGEPRPTLPTLELTLHAPTVVRGTYPPRPDLPGTQTVALADAYAGGLRVWRLGDAEGPDGPPTPAEWTFGWDSIKTNRWQMKLPGGGRYILIGQHRVLLDCGAVYYTTRPVEFEVSPYEDLQIGRLEFDVPDGTVEGELRVNGEPAQGWRVSAKIAASVRDAPSLKSDDDFSYPLLRRDGRAYVIPSPYTDVQAIVGAAGSFEIPYLPACALDLGVTCAGGGRVVLHAEDPRASGLSLRGPQREKQLDLSLSSVLIDSGIREEDWWRSPEITVVSLDSRGASGSGESSCVPADVPVWLSPGFRYRLEVRHEAYEPFRITIIAPPAGEQLRYELNRAPEERDDE